MMTPPGMEGTHWTLSDIFKLGITVSGFVLTVVDSDLNGGISGFCLFRGSTWAIGDVCNLFLCLLRDRVVGLSSLLVMAAFPFEGITVGTRQEYKNL